MEANTNDNNGIDRAHPACSPCKLQRRKCGPDCLLAPYFPFEKKDEFESVRRICSLKSLTEMIKNVEAPEERQRLAEAVTWVAGCWDEDPVLGAAGKYLRVLQQVEDLKRENATLRERLSNRIHQPSPNGYMAHSPNGYQFCLPVQQQLQLQLQQQHYPNGHQYCLPVQQQLQQQQHSPNGYQYCFPEQLYGNVLDDTQSEGSP